MSHGVMIELLQVVTVTNITNYTQSPISELINALVQKCDHPRGFRSTEMYFYLGRSTTSTINRLELLCVVRTSDHGTMMLMGPKRQSHHITANECYCKNNKNNYNSNNQYLEPKGVRYFKWEKGECRPIVTPSAQAPGHLGI